MRLRSSLGVVLSIFVLCATLFSLFLIACGGNPTPPPFSVHEVGTLPTQSIYLSPDQGQNSLDWTAEANVPIPETSCPHLGKVTHDYGLAFIANLDSELSTGPLQLMQAVVSQTNCGDWTLGFEAFPQRSKHFVGISVVGPVHIKLSFSNSDNTYTVSFTYPGGPTDLQATISAQGTHPRRAEFGIESPKSPSGYDLFPHFKGLLSISNPEVNGVALNALGTIDHYSNPRLKDVPPSASNNSFSVEWLSE